MFTEKMHQYETLILVISAALGVILMSFYENDYTNTLAIRLALFSLFVFLFTVAFNRREGKLTVSVVTILYICLFLYWFK
ncbi:hypothetical protein [Planomicrobium sp. CPCC 101110]|uniref:hypothetical protein n=1 Tax=Planomicrobium sp. CPCC 101110 TaxID=2599619 RepID=UPI0011B74BE6|nr:hypothetical protein [Planomicrobium sp. CPCC 101110]TWT25859.1 hypothetical protein FQV30_08665 [Planomicrobium sp. CPCC 101110]